MPLIATHRRVRAFAIALACASALALWVGVSERAEAAPILGFSESPSHGSAGASIDSFLTTQEARAGGTVHRLLIRWDDVEPTRGARYWDHYDRRVNTIRAAGMKPLIIIMAAPRWAQNRLECRGLCPPAPAYLSSWSQFAYDVTKRYPDATAIEVWNEPNWWGQWATSAGPNGARYATLFKAAIGAIKYANPSMRVLIGSVTYSVGDNYPGNLTIPTFLRDFYRAGGGDLLRPGDGIGVHAYPWKNEVETLSTQFGTTMQQIRDAVAKWDPGRPIWVTETGMTTTGSFSVSERDQARGLVNAYRALGGMPDVRAMFAHTIVEPPWIRTYPGEQGYGWLRISNLSPKPVYCAFAQMAGTSVATTGCPTDALAAVGYPPLGGGSGGSTGGGSGGSTGGGSGGSTGGGSTGGGSGGSTGGSPGGSTGADHGDDLADGGKKGSPRWRARQRCRAKLRTRRWWPVASRSDRRIMVKRCVQRRMRARN